MKNEKSKEAGRPRSADHRADVLLKGGTLLNVYSGEMLKTDVVIRGEKTLYIGPVSDVTSAAAHLIDVTGKTLVPGYVEPHFHPWNTYNPISSSRFACARGTTTLFCDNLIFYMIMGIDLFERFMERLSGLPVKLFWFCRGVPQTPMEDGERLFSVENVTRLLSSPAVQSMGEITRWPALIEGNRGLLEMIRGARAHKKRVDGHTAGAKYRQLNQLAYRGVESCHESITADEVLQRLRLGYYVMLRQSSLRPDLRVLLKAIHSHSLLTDRMMLTTDGSSPSFMQESGFTDSLVRIALEEGLDPVSAYRMVTLNPAAYFGLDHLMGGIAPGRDADILILKDLYHPTPEVVFSKGRIIAENGSLTRPFPQVDLGEYLPCTRLEGHFRGEDFHIPASKKRITFPTIKLVSAVITRREDVEFEVRDGFLHLGDRGDFTFVTLLSREGGWVTNGVLQGFGGSVEGLASSFNTAVQILAIGREPEAMATAVNRVFEMGGGIVGVEDKKPVYEFPLPLGGMMSEDPIEILAENDEGLKQFLSARGYPFRDPLYTLMFLPNDFLPDLRINYRGVVDIRNHLSLWPRRDLARG